MSGGKYKLSPAAGGSTIFEDTRNPRKKAFWIFNIIVLAIIFGVLGATVWKPDSNKSGEDPTSTPTHTPSTGPRSSPVPTPATTPVVPASVTAPVVPTPVTGPLPPPPRPSPPPKPTSGGGDMSCNCWDAAEKCDDNCRATDSSYKSCYAQCAGQILCDADCQGGNGCFSGCMNTWSACSRACG